MSPEIKEALTSFFAMIWDIFVKTPVPGTSLTFASLWVGLFCASVFIAFLHKTMDSEVGYKSGKKDYERIGDEKE